MKDYFKFREFAGAAGLCAAKNGKDFGYEVTVFEQTNKIGGTWVYTDNIGKDKNGLDVHSSRYQGLFTNLPKEIMGYPTIPFPEQNKSYIPAEDVLKYYDSYAQQFDLLKLIKFEHHVLRVRPMPDDTWEVIVHDLAVKKYITLNFNVILVCNGHYAAPNTPKIKGQNLFKGRQMHSHDYRCPEFFMDESVLIIGAGPSGTDCTIDISKFAKNVTWSHHLEKPPNTQFNDNVDQKPDVKEITAHEVTFVDGSSQKYSVIIYATGYKYTFPFLSADCGISREENYVHPLFKHCLNINHPTMGIIGLPNYVCPNQMFDLQIRFCLTFMTGRKTLPTKEEMFEDTERDRNERKIKGLDNSKGHYMGVGIHDRYYDDLAATAGIVPIKPVIVKMFAKGLCNTKKQMKLCVIGAGAAGLCAAKRGVEFGCDVIVLEQSEQVGGTWVYTDNVGKDKNGLDIHSSMYRDVKTDIPKEIMGYPDFPYPEQQQSYIPAKDVLEYLQSYAKHFDLFKFIKFNSLVIRVRPLSDDSWEVIVKDLLTKSFETLFFDAVLVCNGHYFLPNFPTFHGQEKFKGRQLHTHDYRVPEIFEGENVLIVGAGPSGLDCVVALSMVAKHVTWSHHSGILTGVDVGDALCHKPDIKEINEHCVTFVDDTTRDFTSIIYATGYKYSFPFLSVDCAGAAGLCAAKHGVEFGCDVTVLEQSEQVGGTWVYTDNVGKDKNGLDIHSSMYRDLHTNAPKEIMGYPDFPYPEQQQSYIPAKDVLEYLQSYAKHFDLFKFIKFNSLVIRVRPLSDDSWEVIVKDLLTKSFETLFFDAVLVCNGHYFLPNFPTFHGQEKFKGRQLHTHDYRVPEIFEGENVLIVGAGPSGLDCVVALSMVAKHVTWSHHSGILSDVDVGDAICHKPDIKEINEHCVTFVDDTTRDFTSIIYATGYKYSFPFLSVDCGIGCDNGHVSPLFKHCININHSSMGIIGVPNLTCPNQLFDLQIRFFLTFMTGRKELPSKAKMLEDTEREMCERKKKGLVNKKAHFLGPEMQKTYFHDLATIADLVPILPCQTEGYSPGAAGLCAAKHGVEFGCDVTVLEQSEQVGGTWVYTDNVGKDKNGLDIHSSMYRDVKTDIPKEIMGYPDFPYPEQQQSYIPAKDVLEYLQSYAKHFDLFKFIKFNSLVIRVRPLSDDSWEVIVKDLLTKSFETLFFDAVLVCNGHYFLPNFPTFHGQEKFKGRQLHTHDYRVPEIFEGENVLIIGAGPSGLDCILEVSKVAKNISWSHHPSGILSDVDVGDAICHKPDIKEINEHCVTFVDDTTRDFTSIIYATGYKYSFPFLSVDCGIGCDNGYVSPLFKHCLNINHSSMGIIGVPSAICANQLFDLQIRFCLTFMTGRKELPSKIKMLEDTERDIAMRKTYGLVNKKAHFMGTDLQKIYFDDLATIADLVPILTVINKLFTRGIHEFIHNTTNFRKGKYKIVDEENFINL
ncbi:CLUMA_CG011039, isoform A [Clunio marinus]|uniref:Flavin-containing monooxygenase n=1 Tax=Clunio marinus TaxID=568069 RepID=A0A1J1IF81_9DIPT|nr:CLUMA_CG011039, isoform A [Clunio marinus]